jgi:hypothetical protein
MKDEKALLTWFRLEKMITGLSNVELKKLNNNAICRQSKTLAKQKKKKQGNVCLGKLQLNQ